MWGPGGEGQKDWVRGLLARRAKMITFGEPSGDWVGGCSKMGLIAHLLYVNAAVAGIPAQGVEVRFPSVSTSGGCHTRYHKQG